METNFFKPSPIGHYHEDGTESPAPFPTTVGEFIEHLSQFDPSLSLVVDEEEMEPSGCREDETIAQAIYTPVSLRHHDYACNFCRHDGSVRTVTETVVLMRVADASSLLHKESLDDEF